LLAQTKGKVPCVVRSAFVGHASGTGCARSAKHHPARSRKRGPRRKRHSRLRRTRAPSNGRGPQAHHLGSGGPGFAAEVACSKPLHSRRRPQPSLQSRRSIPLPSASSHGWWARGPASFGPHPRERLQESPRRRRRAAYRLGTDRTLSSLGTSRRLRRDSQMPDNS
jgi:hypothetical protein